jgi:hypothetical protein
VAVLEVVEAALQELQEVQKEEAVLVPPRVEVGLVLRGLAVEAEEVLVASLLVASLLVAEPGAGPLPLVLRAALLAP